MKAKKKTLIALILFSITMLVITPVLFDFEEYEIEQEKVNKFFKESTRDQRRYEHLEPTYDPFILWKPMFYVIFFLMLGAISYLLLVIKNAYKIQSGLESKGFHAINYVSSCFDEITFSEKQKLTFLLFFVVFYGIGCYISFCIYLYSFETDWFLIPVGVALVSMFFFLFCDVNPSKCKNNR